MFMIDGSVNPNAVRTLVIGFSAASQNAASRLVQQGQPIGSILVVANHPDQVALALSLGFRSEVAAVPAAIEEYLKQCPSKVIVDVQDDACAEELVRIVRRGVPRALVLVRAVSPQAVPRLLATGASEAFCDASIAGKLMAATALPPRHPAKGPLSCSST